MSKTKENVVDKAVYAFNRKVFCDGMRDGFPIALGYFAVSFSLGIAARKAGLTPLQGFFASLFNNASAGEYAAFTLIAAHATYLEVAIITLIANARYLLMSCALAQRCAPGMPFYHRLIVGYDVTDELFGITIARPGYLNPFYTYGAILLAAPAWALGTAFGIMAGNALPLRIVSALSVALYGMFLAIIIPPAKKDKVVGVEAINQKDGSELTFHGPVILATGHSARDVYRYLFNAKIEIESKGIAVGVRLEHPSELIDQIQYHNKNGRGKYLPAAEYSFVTQVDGRGVYSFCMCPGGFVIPAATGDEQIVVNGMSPSNRGTAWSNSGMVVELHPEDVEGDDVLNVMRFQEQLEKNCWQQGNMKQTAPAQRMADFVNGKLSYDLPKSSYAPGLISSPLHFWLPEMISSRLREGFKTFGKHAHGFLTNEAVCIATETRTSSPVRILRDRETLQHIRIQGLFPCGEGAGYAGGIVSAGVDGERCADAMAEYINQLG